MKKIWTSTRRETRQFFREYQKTFLIFKTRPCWSGFNIKHCKNKKDCYNCNDKRGISSVVERDLPKVEMRVRFSYPAQETSICRCSSAGRFIRHLSSVGEQRFRKAKVPSSNLGGGSSFDRATPLSVSSISVIGSEFQLFPFSAVFFILLKIFQTNILAIRSPL